MARLLVNVDVGDLSRGERFYCAALGLVPGRRFGDGAVELLGAEAPLYLLAQEEGSPAAEAPGATRSWKRHWTPVHLDFVVEALEPAIERACAAGAQREGGIRSAPWGRLQRLADPFGHGLCLLEFSARGYDAITTG